MTQKRHLQKGGNLTHSPISCLLASTSLGRVTSSSPATGIAFPCAWSCWSISDSSTSISSPENPKLNAIVQIRVLLGFCSIYNVLYMDCSSGMKCSSAWWGLYRIFFFLFFPKSAASNRYRNRQSQRFNEIKLRIIPIDSWLIFAFCFFKNLPCNIEITKRVVQA